MTLTRKVAFNTLVQIVGKIVVTTFSLIVVGYLTRYLGVAGYGIYTTIFAFVSFWAVLADFGFFWILVRELSKPDTDHSAIFNNVLTLKLFFGLIVFALCALIGFLIPQYSWTVKIGIAIIAASWFWMSLNNTYVGLFQSKIEMYKAVITEVVGRLVILTGVIWLVYRGFGLESILIMYIIGNFVNFLLSFILGSFRIRYRLSFNLALWRIIFIESFPLALLSIIGVIHFKIDTIILSIFKSPMDVGIYGVPYKILEIIIFLPGIFIGNVFPILTKYYHAKDKRLQTSIQKTFDFLTMLAMPIVFSLIILSTPIIRFIAGEEYLTAYTVELFNIPFTAPMILMILAVSIGVSFLLNIFSNLLTVAGKQKKQVTPMLIVTAINVLANIILIPRYSYLAAAAVNLMTGFLMFFWWMKLAHQHVKFRLNYRILSKCLISSFMMALVLYLLRKQNLFLTISIGAVVYFVVAYLTKVFDKNIITSLLPNFRKGKQ